MMVSRVLALVVVTAAVLLAGATPSPALERGAFGWRGEELASQRPLLAVWLRDADDLAPEQSARYLAFYRDRLFGHAGAWPPRADERFAPSVPGYFREVSAGRFTLGNGGLVGPVVVPHKGKPAAELARLAIAAAAQDGRIDFRAFDRNHDGRIGADELAVLVITESPTRALLDVSAAGSEIAVAGQDVAFAGRIAMVGENDGLATVNRELFHALARAAVDLDGVPRRCFALDRGLSLMAAANSGNPQATMHLDPWHKMLAGWIEPRVALIGKSGRVRLAAQHVADAGALDLKRPLLIYDGERGPSEFFLLEYRTRSMVGFDQDLPTSGLVIWQVRLDATGQVAKANADRANCKGETIAVPALFVRGAPDWQLGVPRAYTSTEGPVSLKWMDGSDSGVRISVGRHQSIDWAIDVSWSAPAPR